MTQAAVGAVILRFSVQTVDLKLVWKPGESQWGRA